MLSSPVRALLATMLLLTGVMLGCSGDSVRLDDYRKSVADLFTAFNADITALSSQLRTEGTKEEVFRSLEEYAQAGSQRSARMLTDWDALKLPERARDVHKQGRALIEGYKAAFDQLEAGARAQDERARDLFNTTLEQDLPALAETFQNDLNALK